MHSDQVTQHALEAATRLETLAAELKTVLDREAASYFRHHQKIETLTAENERLREAGSVLADAAAAAIYGLPEMLEANALSDDEGMVRQIEMALTAFRAALKQGEQ